MVPDMEIHMWALIQGLGTNELLIILLIVLLLFGAKKLPELARGLGKSMKEFKKATQEVQDDFQEAMDSVELEEKRKQGGKNEESPNAQQTADGASPEQSADQKSEPASGQKS